MTAQPLGARRDIGALFSSTVANPANRIGVAGGSADRLVAYRFVDTSNNHKGSYCAGLQLMAAATKKEVWSPDEAACYVLTLAEMMTPGALAALNASPTLQIDIHERAEDLSSFDSGSWAPNDTDGVPEADWVRNRVMTPVTLDLIGEIGEADFAFAPRTSTAMISEEIAGGRWGIEMFPIGKQANSQNIPGFQEKRPEGVFGRFGIKAEDQKDFFRGEYLPALLTLQAVGTAFDVFPNLRYSLASRWITALSVGGNRIERAFNVTFALTDGYGFGAAIAVGQLLVAYPVLREYTALKDKIANADYLFDKFAELGPERRGFMKILYGANYTLFKSINRGILIAVATEYKTMTDPTFRNFFNTEPYLPFIHEMNRWLANRGFPRITTNRTEAGVPAALE